MESFQTFIILMFAAIMIVGISQKIHLPYPIALILGGAAIGFSHHEQPSHFNPNTILFIVLPPILYYASFAISFREFKHNFKDILSLALGLVVLTTLVVGLLFKWIFPHASWPLAFAFGAIVSPPDATAATTILKRFSISNKLLIILEGESLINDASALVLYKLSTVALLSGVFSFADAGIEFIKISTGGIAIGVALGFVIQNFSRHFLEPIVGVVLSFSIPYVTYILADALGFSGVLAVVVNGLMGSRILIKHPSAIRRILGYATWDIFIILMNCFVFILIGLELPTLTRAMTVNQILTYSLYALLITLVMIAVRLFWIASKNTFSYIQALKDPNPCTSGSLLFRETILMSWSGMRGIVSLTAALALPYTYADGTALAGRNDVIVISFLVILSTLIIPGLTLPYMIKILKLHKQPENIDLIKVRNKLTKVAQDTIQQLNELRSIDDKEYQFLQTYFNLQPLVIEIATSATDKMQHLKDARSKIIQEQRKKLFEIWEQLEIDDDLLHQLEHELDLEETHMTRAELK